MNNNLSKKYKIFLSFYLKIKNFIPEIEYFSYLNINKIGYLNSNIFEDFKSLNFFKIPLTFLKRFLILMISIFNLQKINKNFVKKNILISYETDSKNEIYLELVENFLSNQEKEHTKILISNKSRFFKKYSKQGFTDIIILSSIDNFFVESKIFINDIIKIFKVFFNKKIKYQEKKFLIYSIINEKSSSDFRIYYQIKNIIANKHLKIKNLFIPFEGHIFERLLCENFPNKTIGFQIAPIYKSSLSIHNLNENQFPSLLFTLSDFYRNKLLKMYPNHKLNVFTLGKSNISFVNKIFFFDEKKKINIILCPEGTLEDIFFFINYSVNNLNHSNINLYLSVHPIIKKSIIQNFLVKNNINNIIFFSKSLNLRCINTFSLYSGSSSAIKFLLQGYMPIYLNRGFDEANPLDDFKDYMISLDQKNNFLELIDNFKNKFIDGHYIFQSEINKISKLIEPINEDLLEKNIFID